MTLARIIEAVPAAAGRGGELARRQPRAARTAGLKRLLPCLLFGCCVQASAASGAADFLAAVADALPAREVEVLPNLNDRAAFSRGPQVPRLGGFFDLPPGAYPGSAEIEAWETAYRAGEIGGLALRPAAAIASRPDGGAAGDVAAEYFRAVWLGEPQRERLFVSFAAEDEKTALLVARVAGRRGYDALPLRPGEAAGAGEFYATARHRLAIDSRAARRLRAAATELELLGKRRRRNSDSVFRDPANRDDRGLSRREPEIFRKITLGDEFNQSTIEEIVVPGGIAFGESAELDFTPAELIFNGDFFILRGVGPETGSGDIRRRLPPDEPRVLKALFDLSARSLGTRSDAVADLDAERRVRISSALRDTDVGYAMLFADVLPFEHLAYLPVTKSVIIDTGASWRRSEAGDGSAQEFATDFEVRLLSADNMRIARTRLALEYAYDSASGAVRYQGNWGRYSSRLRASTDVDGLGAELAELARHAGWVALFRRLAQDSVPFLKGRYQFMRIDKAGRETPRRFR